MILSSAGRDDLPSVAEIQPCLPETLEPHSGYETVVDGHAASARGL